MATYTIKKKEGSKGNLSWATKRMAWKRDGFVIAGNQTINNIFYQDGFPADLEYGIDDGDLIVEVDADGNEVARETFSD